MVGDGIDWSVLTGGYRVPYDPRPAIGRLYDDRLDDVAWRELWEELHHQGDVGEASYAAVPLLVEACTTGPRDWNFHGLIATIETERHRRANPAVPSWLKVTYEKALSKAGTLALEDLGTADDPEVIRSALAVVALARGDLQLGALLSDLDSSELQELVNERFAWSDLYDADAG